MRQKGIISTNQYTWTLFSIITSFMVLQIAGILLFQAGRDAWLSVLGAWFLDALLAIVYAHMGLRFPGQNMIQYSITLLGKYAGRIIGIMFPLYFIFVAAILLRSLTAMIENLFLPKTPMAVILFISYLFVAYGVRKGIEPIARICEVLGPFYLLSMLLLFALAIPQVEVHRLLPLFVNGLSPSLLGIPIILSFNGICIIMGMLIPLCNRPENGFLGKFIAVSLGSLIFMLLICICTGIFGAEQAGNMVNPGIQLARLVRLGTFLERVEIIWLLVATAAGIMTATNMLWAFSLGISQIVGLDSYKSLVYPAVLIAFILSMTCFDSNIKLFNFQYYAYFIVAMFVQTGLEMFLFIVALISGKREENAPNLNDLQR